LIVTRLHCIDMKLVILLTLLGIAAAAADETTTGSWVEAWEEFEETIKDCGLTIEDIKCDEIPQLNIFGLSAKEIGDTYFGDYCEATKEGKETVACGIFYCTFAALRNNQQQIEASPHFYRDGVNYFKSHLCL